MRKIYLKYADMDRLMGALVRRVSRVKFDKIVAIPKGGLPIGVHLANYFGCDLIWEMIEYPKIDTKRYVRNDQILLVDDICDTGQTFMETLDILRMLGIVNIVTVAPFWKPHQDYKYQPNIWLERTLDWIVFPWEDPREIPNRPMYAELGSGMGWHKI